MKAYAKTSLISTFLLSILFFCLFTNHIAAQGLLKDFLGSSEIEEGKQYKSDGDYPSAISNFSSSIKENPANLEAHYQLGLLFEEVMHDYDEAISLYKNVIRLSEGIRPIGTDEELRAFNSLITNIRESLDRAIRQKYESIEKPKVPVYIMVKPNEMILKEPKQLSISKYKTAENEEEFRLLDFKDDWYKVNVPSIGPGWVNGKNVFKIILKEDAATETSPAGKAALYERFAELYPNYRFASEVKGGTDSTSYELAKEEGSINSYSNYLKKHPDGKHAKEVRSRLDTLTFQDEGFLNSIDRLRHWINNNPESTSIEKARKRIDELAFAQAKHDKNTVSLEGYLIDYPDGKFVSEAKQLLEDIKNNQANEESIKIVEKKADEANNDVDAIIRIEEQAFNVATKTNTQDAYLDFIKKYPKSKHYKEAMEAYKGFIKEGSDSKPSPLAKNRIEEPAFEYSKTKTTKESKPESASSSLHAKSTGADKKGEESLKVPTDSPPTVSFWWGTMTCGQKQWMLRLTVSGEAQSFEGVLESKSTNINYAALQLQGTLDSETGRFQLKPTGWVHEPRWGGAKPMGLEGVFAKDNKTVKGQVTGGECSTFAARYFETTIPPTNPNGLLFKVASDPKSLTEDDYLVFAKWVNSGKSVSLPNGEIMSHFLDDERMRAVLGKSLFQVEPKDKGLYRTISAQCRKKAEGTFNMELKEECSKVKSWHMGPFSGPGSPGDWFETKHNYIAVHEAIDLKEEQKILAEALPPELKSLAILKSLIAEGQQRDSRIAWIPNDDLKAYQTFLDQRQTSIAQELVDESVRKFQAFEDSQTGLNRLLAYYAETWPKFQSHLPPAEAQRYKQAYDVELKKKRGVLVVLSLQPKTEALTHFKGADLNRRSELIKINDEARTIRQNADLSIPEVKRVVDAYTQAYDAVREEVNRIDQINFEYYQKKNTLKAYRKFVTKYPENVYANKAIQNIILLRASNAGKGTGPGFPYLLIIMIILGVGIATSGALKRERIASIVRSWLEGDWSCDCGTKHNEDAENCSACGNTRPKYNKASLIGYAIWLKEKTYAMFGKLPEKEVIAQKIKDIKANTINTFDKIKGSKVLKNWDVMMWIGIVMIIILVFTVPFMLRSCSPVVDGEYSVDMDTLSASIMATIPEGQAVTWGDLKFMNRMNDQFKSMKSMKLKLEDGKAIVTLMQGVMQEEMVGEYEVDGNQLKLTRKGEEDLTFTIEDDGSLTGELPDSDGIKIKLVKGVFSNAGKGTGFPYLLTIIIFFGIGIVVAGVLTRERVAAIAQSWQQGDWSCECGTEHNKDEENCPACGNSRPWFDKASLIGYAIWLREKSYAMYGKLPEKEVIAQKAKDIQAKATDTFGEMKVRVNRNPKNMAMIIWVGMIILSIVLVFIGFVPALFFYITRKDDPFILSHAKEALNWYITYILGGIVAAIPMLFITWVKGMVFEKLGYYGSSFGLISVLLEIVESIIGPLSIAWTICFVVFCVIGALSAYKGKDYRLPFAIRFFKNKEKDQKVQKAKKKQAKTKNTSDKTNLSQDSKNMAVIIWVGSFIAQFIPALYFYLTRKDDPFILSHAKEALNWYITFSIGFIAGLPLVLLLIGIPLLIAWGICFIVFIVKGALSASKGKDYRIPFTIIRLIK